MTMQILLNLAIALVWMLLHDAWNTLTFTEGFIIGLVMIFFLRRFFPGPFYGKKIWSIAKLIGLFSVELVKSSLLVIFQITRPKLRIKPGIFKIETVLKSDWEIMMLSNMITLTPGSVVIEVAPREGVMFVHAMDVSGTLESAIVATKVKFEKAIMEVSR